MEFKQGQPKYKRTELDARLALVKQAESTNSYSRVFWAQTAYILAAEIDKLNTDIQWWQDNAIPREVNRG